MDRTEEIKIRRLQRLVNAETDRARKLYPRGIERSSPYEGLSVLAESVGKVNRCFHKYRMAEDPDVVRQWRRELKDEMVRCNSILDRIYLTFVEDGNGNGNQMDDGNPELRGGLYEGQSRL